MNVVVTINRTEGVSGGYPCIDDTRIAVRLIVESFCKTGDVEKTAAAFPQLSPDQIEAALAYYREHPAIIDEDIARNARLLAAFLTR